MNNTKKGPAGAENTPGPWPSLVGADGETLTEHAVAALVPHMTGDAWSPTFLAYVKRGERRLDLPPDLPIEDWLTLGEDLHRIEDHHQWWLGDWWLFGERTYGTSAARAASTGFALKTVQNWASVARKFEPSRRREDVAFSHHAAAAALPVDQADEVLTRVALEDLGLDETRQLVNRQRRAEKMGLITKKAADLATIGKFAVVLADPPWQIDGPPARAPENHYETMSLEDICKLDVPAADDAILYLWAPNCMTGKAVVTVMEESWGFNYKGNFVWVKNRQGLGHYCRNRHELLHIGTRGDFPPPLPETLSDSVIEEPRGEHSVKPGVVYDMIDGQYPDIPKVELFARGLVRPGWTAWGDQAIRVTP